MSLLHLMICQHHTVMKARKRSTGYIFVDIKKAFDSLVRALLFAQSEDEVCQFYTTSSIPIEQQRSVIDYIRSHPCVLVDAGVPPALVNTIACWSEQGWCQLDPVCGSVSFTAQQGAKQGDGLAPLLFAYYRRQAADAVRSRLQQADLLTSLP
eukprot:796145-Amphidinium_carterae.1